MRPRIWQGDNLEALRAFAAAGRRFDLVELDGPYMAGLEEWDRMTEAEYIEHYAARLSLVRRVLEPWGVVFVFGYPEGCAEIKAWAHRTGTLYCRRWLTWYKHLTANKGRKVEAILLLWRDSPDAAAAAAWGRMLRARRLERGWTLRELGDRAGRRWWHRGGNLYYETGSAGLPSMEDYLLLADLFEFDRAEWWRVVERSHKGLTDVDVVGWSYAEDTVALNGDGLRAKPVGLYVDLFGPVSPPGEKRRALVLYGGSGNAGIAAAALGYDVTICEEDGERCVLMRERWAQEVERWSCRVGGQAALPGFEAEQLTLLGGV